ncbi:TPA: attachment protein [Pseudomonas aeruginosa]|nr:attachment protein [Pseudomonas aeruginosa]MCO1901343.1 attachment protein [Pseudomonas aeruginosa]HBO3051475.1 attachment protein [Pseudomonas aeruginosa]HBO4980210.1 attachment protein [Pseudomonas aeruginosa]HBP5110858.1 attachment protein [Pseudomonas aeruginosa]
MRIEKRARWFALVRQVCAVLLVLCSWSAYAEPYYWQLNGPTAPDRFTSPSAACEVGLGMYKAQYPTVEMVINSREMRGSTNYVCTVFRYFNGNRIEPNFTISVMRKGTGCAEGSTYNAQTGVCETPPENNCIKGLTDLFSSPPSNIFVSGGRNFVNSSPPTACKNGCQYLPTTSKTTSCYRYPGSDNQGFCNYVLMTDGSACAADSGNPGMTGPSLNDTPPTNPDEPPSDPNDPGCPPGYSWSGTTCVKTPTDPTEPGGDGGDGGNTGGGDGGNCDPAKQDCSPGPAGPGGELKEPKPGTWDDAIATWEQKVEQAKKELKDKVRANVDQMKGAFDLNLAEGGGQLPCESMTIWGRSYSLCVADYADQLSNLRVALLLMAALIAAFILLRD